MPISQKQLDQRYESVCNHITDAKDYTIQHLKPNIQLAIPSFYANLGSSNLEQLEAEMDVMEEVLNQCRIAIKNEQSRRSLQDQIILLTERQTRKADQKRTFKMSRRAARLVEATPYPTPPIRQPSIPQ